MNSKRNFLKAFIGSLVGFPLLKGLRAQYKPRVVVIGGGFGGGSCLRYLDSFSDKLSLVLVEKEQNYYTCPFSNYVVGGFRKINKNQFNYDKLENRGIKVLRRKVTFIDSDKKKIFFADGNIVYDYLILSPGVSFKWNDIDGFNKNLTNKYPVGWTGGQDVQKIYKKIDSLDDGSKIVIVPPDYPYRCPPAPYERASLIANFLKKKKINSKILIFDCKNSFTKSELFFSAWNKLYPDMIEWIPKSKGGKIIKLDPQENLITSESGQKIKADFLNIIPNQKASDLISNSNLISDDWCKVNPKTFNLENHKKIFALGDSIDGGDMPKSAFSANSQAKVCAENLLNTIFEKRLLNPVFLNTCYSLAAENYGFAISSWYRVSNYDNRIVSLGSRSSPTKSENALRIKEAKESYQWYESITDEIFGT